MGNLGFTLTEEDYKNNYSPLPAGEYPVVVTDTEIKPTKEGTGKFVKVTHQVVDGPYNGKFIVNNINIQNPNPVAVEISKKTLAKIEKALGLPVGGLQNHEQMRGVPVRVHLTVKQDDKYGPGNEIKNYLPYLPDSAPAGTGLEEEKKPWEM